MSYNLCNKGKKQSPINILSDDTLKCTSKQCHLSFYYKPSDECHFENKNEKIFIYYPKGSYVIYNLEKFHLEKFTFMLPSSHAIDNKKSLIEMQLYHRTKKNKILIISVLINVTEDNSVSTNFFEMFLNYLPSSNEPTKKVNMKGKNWNVFYGLPFNKNFYSYTGSILYVPCDSNVQWIVMEKRVSMSKVAYQKLKMIQKEEPRNLKKKYDRTVFHTVDTKNLNHLITHRPKVIKKLKEIKYDYSNIPIYIIVFIIFIIIVYFLSKSKGFFPN